METIPENQPNTFLSMEDELFLTKRTSQEHEKNPEVLNVFDRMDKIKSSKNKFLENNLH